MSSYKSAYSSSSSATGAGGGWRSSGLGSSSTSSSAAVGGRLSSYSSATYSSSANSKSYSSTSSSLSNPYSSTPSSTCSKYYDSFKESRLHSAGSGTAGTAGSGIGSGSGTESMTSRFSRNNATSSYGSSTGSSKVNLSSPGVTAGTLNREKSSGSNFSRDSSNLSSKSSYGTVGGGASTAREMIREKLSTKLTETSSPSSSYSMRSTGAGASTSSKTMTTGSLANSGTNSLTGSSGSGSSGYHSATASSASRTLANSTGNSMGVGTMSSLRTAARFGLRNTAGTGNSQYPNCSSLLTQPDNNNNSKSGGRKPGENENEGDSEARQQRKAKEANKPVAPTSWMSRSTSPMRPATPASPSCMDHVNKLRSRDDISADETPSVNPQKFDGVVKNKGIQTDKEKELFLSPPPKLLLSSSLATSKYLSSIPRPSSSASTQPQSPNNAASGTPAATPSPSPSPSPLPQQSRISSCLNKSGSGSGNNNNNNSSLLLSSNNDTSNSFNMNPNNINKSRMNDSINKGNGNHEMQAGVAAGLGSRSSIHEKSAPGVSGYPSQETSAPPDADGQANNSMVMVNDNCKNNRFNCNNSSQQSSTSNNGRSTIIRRPPTDPNKSLGAPGTNGNNGNNSNGSSTAIPANVNSSPLLYQHQSRSINRIPTKSNSNSPCHSPSHSPAKYAKSNHCSTPASNINNSSGSMISGPTSTMRKRSGSGGGGLPVRKQSTGGSCSSRSSSTCSSVNNSRTNSVNDLAVSGQGSATDLGTQSKKGLRNGTNASASSSRSSSCEPSYTSATVIRNHKMQTQIKDHPSFNKLNHPSSSSSSTSVESAAKKATSLHSQSVSVLASASTSAHSPSQERNSLNQVRTELPRAAVSTNQSPLVAVRNWNNAPTTATPVIEDEKNDSWWFTNADAEGKESETATVNLDTSPTHKQMNNSTVFSGKYDNGFNQDQASPGNNSMSNEQSSEDDSFDYWSRIRDTNGEDTEPNFGHLGRTMANSKPVVLDAGDSTTTVVTLRKPSCCWESSPCEENVTLNIKLPKPVPSISTSLAFPNCTFPITQLASDDDDDESSSESEHPDVGVMCDGDSDEEEDDDGAGSTGTSSSFEEVDPTSMSQQPQPNYDNAGIYSHNSSTVIRRPGAFPVTNVPLTELSIDGPRMKRSSGSCHLNNQEEQHPLSHAQPPPPPPPWKQLPSPGFGFQEPCSSQSALQRGCTSTVLSPPPLPLTSPPYLPRSTSCGGGGSVGGGGSGSGKMIPLPPNLTLDDATLQLYKDGDYGTYLDLEASISEQQEDFDGFLSNRKNSVVLRAQLPVRVNSIIEKLLTADGRELRRALFALKQIFQEDKDLVHEFVENGGLSCLIKVGSEADQNYQNYILRAIGQVMLYVDGMYGVMRHNETIQWLYSLVASKFRLVQKTALKLLLVFVDYVESNCLLLIEAVHSVDAMKGSLCWSNIMSLLQDHDSSSGGDTELLVYAMTLVNKVFNGIPDLDTYYDQIDALEEQGMEALIQKYMGKQCADLDLIQQFQIYEMVLKHEDGDEDCLLLDLDDNMRQKLMNRKGFIELDNGSSKGRRRSRRHSTHDLTLSTTDANTKNHHHKHSNGSSSSAPASYPARPHDHPVIHRLSSTEEITRRDSDEWSTSNSGSSSPHSSSPAPSTSSSITGSAPTMTPHIITSTPIILDGFNDTIRDQCSLNVFDTDNMTPGLRRRRERAERQKSLVREQLLLNGHSQQDSNGENHHRFDPESSPLPPSTKRDVQNSVNNASANSSPEINARTSRPWMLPAYPNKDTSSAVSDTEKQVITVKRENTVKDLTQKLANQNNQLANGNATASTPEPGSRIGDLSGIISKAKEGLAKSKSKVDIKPNAQNGDGSVAPTVINGNLEQKKSDNELHWDFLVSNLRRPLEICDLDFTELKADDDVDIISPYQLCNISMNSHGPGSPNGHASPTGACSPGGPPPPPPAFGKILGSGPAPPPCAPPPMFGIALKHQAAPNSIQAAVSKHNSNKTKKTVKLFWKEVREDPMTVTKAEEIGSIWNEIQPIPLDTAKLEHLFESRAKDMMNKKQQEVNKFKEIVVLDPKRSNAINIGMTKLPPPRTIKTAILKMDATIINREGIEKLLAMLPTDEERAKIQEAQFANPETPLGSAEQFLLTLASISELTARLKLWAFKLDYENLEKEVAEPLMDLKLGIEALQKNKTFKYILTTLLCIGNFLNGAEAKGFQIDYLAKIPEVKDTVHKHSLLHHLCHTVIEKFPESSDLYSEIGPVTRASRVDFEELANNVIKMENDCKASWDHLRVISKHDGPTNMKLKMSEFLADTAERIIVLQIIHRRVIIRFHKFLLWLGVPAHQVTTTKPHTLFKVISEFALEYRTTRDRVIQQVQKKANHRERNKTRGKMITEQILPNGHHNTAPPAHKSKEDKADAELRQVLNNTANDMILNDGNGTLTWNGRRKSQPTLNGNSKPIGSPNGKSKFMMANGFASCEMNGDDEILESLVKTATQTPATRTVPRERKRTNSRFSDRKSLRRTLRHGLSEEERQLLAAFMANGHSFS